MTKYLFLTTIFVINHAGKPEVSPVLSGKSQGMSSNNSSRSNSEERIRQLEEENARLLMKIDPLRDALAKERAERERLENELKANPIQLPESTYKRTIDEIYYDLKLAKERNESLENKLRPKCLELSKEKKELKAQIAQLQTQLAQAQAQKA